MYSQSAIGWKNSAATPPAGRRKRFSIASWLKEKPK
jgi:hypothetical protein